MMKNDEINCREKFPDGKEKLRSGRLQDPPGAALSAQNIMPFVIYQYNTGLFPFFEIAKFIIKLKSPGAV